MLPRLSGAGGAKPLAVTRAGGWGPRGPKRGPAGRLVGGGVGTAAGVGVLAGAGDWVGVLAGAGVGVLAGAGGWVTAGGIVLVARATGRFAAGGEAARGGATACRVLAAMVVSVAASCSVWRLVCSPLNSARPAAPTKSSKPTTLPAISARGTPPWPAGRGVAGGAGA